MIFKNIFLLKILSITLLILLKVKVYATSKIQDLLKFGEKDFEEPNDILPVVYQIIDENILRRFEEQSHKGSMRDIIKYILYS